MDFAAEPSEEECHDEGGCPSSPLRTLALAAARCLALVGPSVCLGDWVCADSGSAPRLRSV